MEEQSFGDPPTTKGLTIIRPATLSQLSQRCWLDVVLAGIAGWFEFPENAPSAAELPAAASL